MFQRIEPNVAEYADAGDAKVVAPLLGGVGKERIVFSNGSRARLFFAVDALGCLRSLRARSALDGVSWVQRGSVEIAVGQRAPATQSTPSSAPSLGRRSSWELVSASCFVGLGRCELRSVSQHRMHDDSEAARQSDSRFAHR